LPVNVGLSSAVRGAAFIHPDLRFQVDARYSGIVDDMLQTTNSNTVAVSAGAGHAPSAR